MPRPKSPTGLAGEAVAAAHLEAKGMRIVERNCHSRYGEVDLVAKDGDELVFVEVKARRSSSFGAPEESVTERKRERLAMTAQTYLQKHGLEESQWRIDVVAITLQADGPALINHIEAV